MGTSSSPSSGPPTPAPASPLSDQDLAIIALRLVREYAAWIRRRVETITYVADTTVRRQMSVDFVLPYPDRAKTDDPFRRVREGSPILVPLSLPPKDPLTNFDLIDEAGNAMSVWNTRDNGHVAALVLRALVEQEGHTLTNDQVGALEEIARGATREAAQLVGTAGSWLDAALPKKSRARSVFDDLVLAYMLLVQVPYEPGRHRVIKWSIDTPHPWEATGHSSKFVSRVARTVRWLGILDKVQVFPPIAIGQSESYHMEIVAPEEVLITDAFMSTRRWDPVAGGLMTDPTTSVASQKERAHLHASILVEREAAEQARGDRALVVFSLHARRSGTFRALAVTALVISLILTLVAVRIAELDATTAATVLVVFPVVVAAYLARPGEHVFATRLLTGARVMTLTCVVCSLLVATLLAGGVIRENRALVAKASVICQISPTPLPQPRTPGNPPASATASCTNSVARYRDSGLGLVAALLLWGLVGVSWVCTTLLWLAMRKWLPQDEDAKKRRRARQSNAFFPPDTSVADELGEVTGSASNDESEAPDPSVAVRFAAWLTEGEGLAPLARTWAICTAVFGLCVGAVEWLRR